MWIILLGDTMKPITYTKGGSLSLPWIWTLEVHCMSRPQTPPASGSLPSDWSHCGPALSPGIAPCAHGCWPHQQRPPLSAAPTFPQDQVGLWPLSVPSCHPPPSGSFLFLIWPRIDPGSFPPSQSPEGPWNPVRFASPTPKIKYVLVVALVSLFHFLPGSSTCIPLLSKHKRWLPPWGKRSTLSDSGEWLSESKDTSHQDTLPHQSSTSHSAKHSFFSFLPAVLW